MKVYLRLFGFARPISKYAIPYFFCTLLYALFNTFNYVMLIPIINTLFDKTAMLKTVTEMPAINDGQFFQNLINYTLYRIYGSTYEVMDVLILLAFFLVICIFFTGVFRYAGQLLIEKLRIVTLLRLRNSVWDNVIDMHAGFFSNSRKGDIIAKISSDVGVVQFCITNTLQVVFREPFLIIGYMFALVKLSWELTIFAVIFLPVVALVVGTIVKKLRTHARKAQENYANMVSLMDESLGGIKIIKAYNATDYIKDKFHQINKIFSDLSMAMAKRQQLASPMSEFLGVTAMAVVLVYGGSLVIADKISVAGFLAYLGIFSQLTRPVRAITDAFSNINQGIAAGERVFELLDAKSEITDAADAVELKDFTGEIEFRDVRFSYETKEVIKGISFKIKKGETVALVGPSGGGKSTISDLIPRFYDVQGGQILIDGVDIRNYTLESLRAHMGVVAQETILFNDSIEQNIRLGKREAAHEEVVHAAKVDNADSFITDTDSSYGHNIGDRGMKLSGGQRQRLSIARAVLKNPDILILDEATSALDTESEALVQAALDNLLEGRTSLVIAHRLSTIYNADRIVVIDQGTIVEEGNHEELMAKKGLYARLIEMQHLS
ncbi:MAG: ABC transporter ATP-binding protein/permease [Rikenellaceae bacterium]|jgi:subfamily B ATP-binding cassette protein MsbA|nr:ABC transporter ATP-binding protein/permease [Rikenellaceae bacterium]